MTEEVWLACGNPETLIQSLPSHATVPSHASVRKGRLLIAACCRRLASLLPTETQALRDDLLGTMESRVDDPLPEDWTDVIWGDYDLARSVDGVAGCNELVDCYMMLINTGLAGGLMTAAMYAKDNGAQDESAQQTNLVRCIFGNPFRPATLDPSWRTETVVALARGIYDDRAFDRLPILADALQDAGCDSDDILSHCRDAGPHARGCWVVDLVLGKV